jgi:hypothetical protein
MQRLIAKRQSISDNLVELALILRSQTTLQELSEEQIIAITFPDSILGLAILLDVVSTESHECVIDFIDIDSLANRLILNPHQLAAALAICPLLLKRVTENTRLNSYIDNTKQRFEILVDLLQYDNISLKDQILLTLITDYNQILQLIENVPHAGLYLLNISLIRNCIKNIDNLVEALKHGSLQCADDLLKDPKMLRLIVRGFDLVLVIEAAPEHADWLLRKSKLRKILIKDSQLDRLNLSSKALRNYITRILTVAPQCLSILLSESVIFAAVINDNIFSSNLEVNIKYNAADSKVILLLTQVIMTNPDHVDFILNNNDTRKIIINRGATVDIDIIIDIAPHWANTLKVECIRGLLITPENPNPNITFDSLYSADSFLEPQNYNSLIRKPDLLYSIVKVAPQLVEILLYKEQLLDVINDSTLFIMLISVASNAIAFLYAQPRLLKLISNEYALLQLIKTSSLYAGLLFNNNDIRGLLNSKFMVCAILEAAPSCLNILLNDNRICGIIANTKEGSYSAAAYCIKYILQGVEMHCDNVAHTQVRHLSSQQQQLLLNCILHFNDLVAVITNAPYLRSWLLSHADIRLRCITSEEKLATLLEIVNDPKIADIVLFDSAMLALICPKTLPLRVIKVVPHWASIIITPNHLSRVYSGEQMVSVIEVLPELALDYFFNDVQSERSLMRISDGSQLAAILAISPKLLAKFYPYCYLLRKPEDIAKVMVLVTIDPAWDVGAVFPTLYGQVTWPVGLQNIQNNLLNQLLRSMAEINTPRSQLMQAYLLVNYSSELASDLPLANCDIDKINYFLQIVKCQHDLLNLLAPLCQYEFLCNSVKYLLIQIQAVFETIVDFQNSISDYIPNENSKLIVRREESLMLQHFKQLQVCLSTYHFNDFLPSRRYFSYVKETHPISQCSSSLWYQWKRERHLAQEAIIGFSEDQSSSLCVENHANLKLGNF